MKHQKQQHNLNTMIEIIWEVLLIAGIIAVMIIIALDAHADQITSTGAEMRAMFDDASKLTPQQLTIIRDIAKDQLNTTEKLAKMESERAAQQAQINADSALASRVVSVAGALVVILIIILLITIRRQPAAAPVYPSATVPMLEAERQPMLPVYHAERMALPTQQSIMRREHV